MYFLFNRDCTCRKIKDFTIKMLHLILLTIIFAYPSLIVNYYPSLSILLLNKNKMLKQF
ncbi:hypothetical protein BCAH1134_C0096 (plasmid) [Bacillus cereus AH1134]|nr:hypothetical protein BCAH1134_C0096 [Bacillus cereus AH1134]